VISDGSPSRREIPAAQMARHLTSGRHEAPEREQAREDDRFDEKSGESETIGER